MPDYPGTDFAGGTFRPASARTTGTAVIGFIDMYGRTKNVRVGGVSNATNDTEVNELRDALGKVSNAGVYFDTFERTYQINKDDARAFTDQHASVSDIAYLVFVRNDNDVEFRQTIEVPAIDDSYVLPGGAIDSTDDDIIALIAKIEAVLNNRFAPEDNKYAFSYGKVSDRKGQISPSTGPKPTLDTR
jgi:hypothetical protein